MPIASACASARPATLRSVKRFIKQQADVQAAMEHRLDEVAAVRPRMTGREHVVLDIAENTRRGETQDVGGIEHVQPALDLGRPRHMRSRAVGHRGIARREELQLFDDRHLRPDRDQHVHVDLREVGREQVVHDDAAHAVRHDDERFAGRLFVDNRLVQVSDDDV